MQLFGEIVRRSIAALVTASVCSTGLALVTAEPAHALNSCDPDLQKDEKFGPDDWRVRVHCVSLNANTQARGQLIKNNGVDEHTIWFTRLNTYYYTSWDECPFGCSAGSQTRAG